jgi:hypothetical protein
VVASAHRGARRFWILPGGLLAWCEGEGVDYVLGLAKNERLKAGMAKEMAEAKAPYEQTGRAARLFPEFVDHKTFPKLSEVSNREQSRHRGNSTLGYHSTIVLPLSGRKAW